MLHVQPLNLHLTMNQTIQILLGLQVIRSSTTKAIRYSKNEEKEADSTVSIQFKM